VNHSAKKQHHEKARKKHKHELQQHARENAKKERSKLPLYLLAVGVLALLAVVAVTAVR
jgi:hypothetical protein